MYFLQGLFLLAFLLAFVKATERPDIFDHLQEKANNDTFDHLQETANNDTMTMDKNATNDSKIN